MGSSEEHARILSRILIALSKLPHVRIWKNNTGVAFSADGGRVIAYGLKGSADILGILGPNGRFLAIEVKTGNAKQTEQQQRFEAMVKGLGGHYIVARSVDDALNFVGSQTPT